MNKASGVGMQLESRFLITITRRILFMSNAIINAGKALSLAEKRVVCLCIAKLAPETGPKVLITAQDYMAAYGVDDLTEAFNELVAASQILFKRYIRTRSDGVLAYRWISSLHQSKFNYSVTMTFSEEIFPSLPLIREHLPDYILFHIPHLQSIYSWRLLEIYKRAKENNTEMVSFTIKEFSDYMEVPKSYRYDFHNLKQRVIEPAIKELSEKHNTNIKWDTDNAPSVKKVANIYFYFENIPVNSPV